MLLKVVFTSTCCIAPPSQATELHSSWQPQTVTRAVSLRLPVRKTCALCRWDWPTGLHGRQGQQPCPRPCINAKAHRLLVGGGGLGNPPRATARGEAAGLQGSAVLGARARAGRNTRAAAQRAGRRTQARTNSPTPARLLRDERGARPLAKAGAARRCHGLRRRSAPGAIMLPSTRACTAWPPLCNHARPLTAALRDRRRQPAHTLMPPGPRPPRHGPIEQGYPREDLVA